MTDDLEASQLRLEIPAFAGMTIWGWECGDLKNNPNTSTPYRQRMR